MLHALTLFAALASVQVTLPAEPRSLAVGDVDGDGSQEIVLLLVWPAWGSEAETVEEAPGMVSVEVRPILEQRREIHVYRVADEQLVPVLEPLRVGTEMLALGAASPSGAVIALEAEGPARLSVVAGEEGPEIALTRIAEIEPLIARTERISSATTPFVLPAPDGSARIVIPSRASVAVVGLDGGIERVPAPFVEIEDARIRMPLPRVFDVDRDGREDLLFIDRQRYRVAWVRGRASGGFGGALVWDAAPLARKLLAGEDAAPYVELLDAGDVDGDATLEAVFAVREREKDQSGTKTALEEVRGAKNAVLFFRLAPGGVVVPTSERSVRTEGHLFQFDHPLGWSTPFRDLDGDGVVEIVAARAKVGVFGIMRSAASGVADLPFQPRIYGISRDGWGELEAGLPEMNFRVDFGDGELTEFMKIPGDVDGDGHLDVAQILGDRVEVYLASGERRYPSEPSHVVELDGDITSFVGVVFADADADGILDVLSFQALEPEEDVPGTPHRFEISRLGVEP